MIEFGDRIYKDAMMRHELCWMCLSTRKPLKKVEYHKLNKKQIMVCKNCIAMNGHKIVKGAESLCTN